MAPRISLLAALSFVVAGLVVPAASAQQDLRNPDTRDAAQALRQDLRNPDTRDVAEAGGITPEVTVVEVPQAVPAIGDGLDWGDAGIGAGGMLGVVLLTAGGALALAHRKGAARRTAAAG